MLTNNQYIGFARDIAEIFCEGQENPPLCIASVKERIVTNTTNEMFQNFVLPHLGDARFYAFTIIHAPSSEGFIKYLVNGFDIVTGRNKTQMIDGIPGARRNDYAWVYNIHVNEYYQSVAPELHATYMGTVPGKHIVMIEQPNNYGIVYVPSSQGGGQQTSGHDCPAGQYWFNGQCIAAGQGGGGGGGYNGTGIQITSGGQQLTTPPNQTMQPASFEMQSLLIPGLIVGGFLLLKQQKII